MTFNCPMRKPRSTTVAYIQQFYLTVILLQPMKTKDFRYTDHYKTACDIYLQANWLKGAFNGSH